MRTGEIIGAEALVRWQHPERGLLAPAAFLPVIEEHPLSIEPGDWVIDDALRQIAHWRSMGFNMPVSVNVGAQQLQQKILPRASPRNYPGTPRYRRIFSNWKLSKPAHLKTSPKLRS